LNIYHSRISKLNQLTLGGENKKFMEGTRGVPYPWKADQRPRRKPYEFRAFPAVFRENKQLTKEFEEEKKNWQDP